MTRVLVVSIALLAVAAAADIYGHAAGVVGMQQPAHLATLAGMVAVLAGVVSSAATRRPHRTAPARSTPNPSDKEKRNALR